MTSASAITKHRILIGGEWIESSGGEYDEVLNPATGQVIAAVPRGTKIDVDRAVAAARKALPEWLETTPAERSYLLLKMADIIEENAETIARIEAADTGKPIAQAIFQANYSADIIRFMSGAARNLEGLAAGEYQRGYTSYVRREPIGIAAGIVPWNYPIVMAAWKYAPALAAGNAHILKPSEIAPLAILKIVELIQGVLPPGILQVVTGDGTVGQALSEHEDINFISVTGSVHTGRSVGSAAGTSLKRAHLELGGNAPVLIMDDADWDYAKQVLRVGPYFNAGQDCTAASRILAAPNMYDTVVADMVENARGLKVGDPSEDFNAFLGPVISKQQQARVLGMLERAKASGAQILTGGETLNEKGAFVTPAVVVGVDQNDEIVQNEIFGPVATVQRFESEEQGFEWANDTRRRLSASIFTRDHSRAMNASRRLSFGMVWVNDLWAGSTELPHGGFMDAGYGKDMSKYSFEEYTQIKNVTHMTDREQSYYGAEFEKDMAAIVASLST